MPQVDGTTRYTPFAQVWVGTHRRWLSGDEEFCGRRLDVYEPNAVEMAQRIIRCGMASPAGGVDAETRHRRSRERATRRARSEVRQKVKGLQADRMVTLTYRENMVSKERLLADWKNFCWRMRRVQGWAYVATYERQRRGAWHLHVAVRGRQNYRVLRAVWRSVVGQDNGNVDVRNPWKERALRHKLASYLSKYIAKNFEDGDPHEKRFWSSRGIERPAVVRYCSRSGDLGRLLELVPGFYAAAGEFMQFLSACKQVYFAAVTAPDAAELGP